LAHCALVEHAAPRGSETCITLVVGAGFVDVVAEVVEVELWADETDAEVVDIGVDEGESDDPTGPLQVPPTQVFAAHWLSEEQLAWKEPQVGTSIELTA
jgi:hypothetical protein